MFAAAYFGDRMFAPRYFPKTGAVPPVVANDGPQAMTGLSGYAGIHGPLYPGWYERPMGDDRLLCARLTHAHG